MSWQTSRMVEFQHCDPAGIVFYPRYFEIINSVIEEFFRTHVDYSFGPMHMVDRRGVPTLKISVEFQNPSRLEDDLDITLDVLRIGSSSLDLRIICAHSQEPRFIAHSTLVRMDLDSGKSDPWPDAVRARLNTD